MSPKPARLEKLDKIERAAAKRDHGGDTIRVLR